MRLPPTFERRKRQEVLAQNDWKATLRFLFDKAHAEESKPSEVKARKVRA